MQSWVSWCGAWSVGSDAIGFSTIGRCVTKKYFSLKNCAGYNTTRRSILNLELRTFLGRGGNYLAAAAILAATSAASSALTMRWVPSGGSAPISGPMELSSTVA